MGYDTENETDIETYLKKFTDKNGRPVIIDKPYTSERRPDHQRGRSKTSRKSSSSPGTDIDQARSNNTKSESDDESYNPFLDMIYHNFTLGERKAIIQEILKSLQSDQIYTTMTPEDLENKVIKKHPKLRSLFDAIHANLSKVKMDSQKIVAIITKEMDIEKSKEIADAEQIMKMISRRPKNPHVGPQSYALTGFKKLAPKVVTVQPTVRTVEDSNRGRGQASSSRQRGASQSQSHTHSHSGTHTSMSGGHSNTLHHRASRDQINDAQVVPYHPPPSAPLSDNRVLRRTGRLEGGISGDSRGTHHSHTGHRS